MKSRASRSFWAGFDRLPSDIQKLAVKQYLIWLANPRHPSLHFKKVHRCWTVRVSEDYRAVGVIEADTMIWFWIGTHADYDRLLKRA
jgi:hypothetical protein